MGLVRKKLGPFLQRVFPNHSDIVLLLDGEKTFRTPAVKKVYKEFNISLLPSWPPTSPELNPQENVWPWAEDYLRNVLGDDKRDTFEMFQKDALDLHNQRERREHFRARNPDVDCVMEAWRAAQVSECTFDVSRITRTLAPAAPPHPQSQTQLSPSKNQKAPVKKSSLV